MGNPSLGKDIKIPVQNKLLKKIVMPWGKIEQVFSTILMLISNVKKILQQGICPPIKIMYNLQVRKNYMPQEIALPSKKVMVCPGEEINHLALIYSPVIVLQNGFRYEYAWFTNHCKLHFQSCFGLTINQGLLRKNNILCLSYMLDALKKL